MTNWQDYITVDPSVCHGKACITGTRIMASVVLDNLADVMKFKVDENLPVEVVNVLEKNGHSAVTVLGQDLGGEPDSHIAEVCQKEKRALITLDTDFFHIRKYSP